MISTMDTFACLYMVNYPPLASKIIKSSKELCIHDPLNQGISVVGTISTYIEKCYSKYIYCVLVLFSLQMVLLMVVFVIEKLVVGWSQTHRYKQPCSRIKKCTPER
jgi:hypothetical protein